MNHQTVDVIDNVRLGLLEVVVGMKGRRNRLTPHPGPLPIKGRGSRAACPLEVRRIVVRGMSAVSIVRA